MYMYKHTHTYVTYMSNVIGNMMDMVQPTHSNSHGSAEAWGEPFLERDMMMKTLDIVGLVVEHNETYLLFYHHVLS